MTTFGATVLWTRPQGAIFTDNKYSRAHVWQFDGGAEVPASSSPHIVRLPYSTAENVDPEEAFVASISSCHMLFFLNGAARKGFVVDEYRDMAEGELAKNDKGKLYVSRVTLRPNVTYASAAPDAETEQHLHHDAHEQCFIANSVVTHISVQPV
ncbi:OsmC family protein [Phyllobacterium endophyticum]|uniref:Peroxiredoxin n=1 Tax=Phyllobacterium endophyticum TaxID=1149773 RepID=A0A2P7B2E8_9HYPH|nr:OsmC family protein [Phyllobacterium endophyticum]MBB3235755.1 organic hydroperoxide reductase OsmC/OhrA [Phyllobacterium endophyticum]PSH60643.1 peroxiredoxin [Phyllobacterium endophyticum]TXR48224.1 OsmC family peroxiredoxin [Phyllobacterium endophyticum]TYR41782.1 OsmC family peroxiredoxin [Phyllobacterium endophyticum]